MVADSITIDKNNKVSFNNNVDYCIGTGRMGLALQREYFNQLKLVQEKIGFSHIRGHGLFSDDMAIYHEYKDSEGNYHAEYNFTYLDLVMDSYKELHIKPFLELGFMPAALASGTQTIFYWKGNTTPPKSEQGWCELVKATLGHLMERYGVDEVVTWPVEVWNEPNLPGFWENADMQKYFRLFEITFGAVKELDSRFRVGGPAVCGVNDEYWIREFMKFCREKKLAVDFITRHHYTTELPESEGHYGYQRLSEPEPGFENLMTTRRIIDEFEEYTGREIHITEFNTSYIPNNPIHDTNLNAAYIAQQLSRLGDMNESYSYWTFGDIFEECGVPFTPFHGGFGLVADGCIPKPTFWIFNFYKKLRGDCVYRSDEVIVTLDSDGIYHGIMWNPCYGDKKGTINVCLDIPAEDEEKYCLVKKTVDENTCNPLKAWHELGEPAALTAEQKEIILEVSGPFVETEGVKAKAGVIRLDNTVTENGVVYFELLQIKKNNDRGYDYERALMA